MATFSKFSSLPNEMMLNVIETTDPEDIESLALCCKLVHTLAGKTLAQHKADKDRWWQIRFCVTWFYPDAECLDAFFLFRDIATNRRLQRYPREVTFRDRDFTGHRVSPFVAVDIKDQVVQACNTVFKDLESPYIAKDEMDTLYNKLIDVEGSVSRGEVNSGTANSLLLTLLPSVERIGIAYLTQLSTGFVNMIHKIARINRDAPPSMRSRLSLTRLSEVEIESSTPLDDAQRDTGILEAFMALPSLRIMRLEDLGVHFPINRWLDSTVHPNMSEIYCTHCSLDATHLGSLLERVECLRVFSYDHATLRRPVPVGKVVSPGTLLDLVFQHARNSLTYLNFTTDAEDLETMGAVRPFRGFEALKIMRISSVMLLEDTEWVPKKLVDELPASLEELELVEETSPEEAQSMFADMLEMKRERLPNLRYVVFEGRIPFDEETIEAYERAGVMLDWRINDYSNTRYSRFFKTDRSWLGGIICKYFL